jgi:rubrerythrin
MDITKFNNELKTKVALVKSYEKRNEIDLAIKLWLEISEITLKYSKSRGIDATYRNMLITRTKGIVNHIKNLKAGQVEKILLEDNDYIQDEAVLEKESSEITQKERSRPQLHETKVSEEIRPTETVENKKTKIIKNSDLKSIPEGFKEIQTSTDFKIVAPHDEDYVKKRLSQETNSSQEQKTLPKQERYDFEQPEESENLICFACGYDKNPKNAKTCKSCGTTLN